MAYTQFGTDNPNSIFKNPDFLKRLKELGYKPTIEGYELCLLIEIHKYPLVELSRKLNISTSGVKDWMVTFGIKNPRGPGGANNPYGLKGNPNKQTKINEELNAV